MTHSRIAMHRRRSTAVGLLCATLHLAGCADELPTPPPPVSIRITALTPYAENALSLRVHYESRGGDSVRVLHTDPAGITTETPAQPAAGGSPAFVLGLGPSTRYRVQRRLYAGRTVSTSDTVSAATGALPAPLQQTRIQISAGRFTSGYNLANVNRPDGAFLVAFDSAGQVRWYRQVSDGVPSREAKQQRNGNFTVYVGNAIGSNVSVGEYIELRPTGEEVHRFGAPPPLYTDNHEFLMTFRPSGELQAAFLFGYDFRRLPPTRPDGADSVLVAHQLLRVTQDGRTQMVFNAWDHFGLSDRIERPDLPVAPDIDHPNSVDLDTAGNLIVSWRNMAAVTKIDALTGAVLWQLGGAKNQFTILNDPLGGFSGQHSISITPSGTLLIFDNGERHAPSESRVVEYRLDVANRTATLVWQFRHAPVIFSGSQSSAQRLANGNTLAAYTSTGTLVELAPDGTILGEGIVRLDDAAVGGFYRVTRIRSLYHWAAP
jgi:hypothetical protein